MEQSYDKREMNGCHEEDDLLSLNAGGTRMRVDFMKGGEVLLIWSFSNKVIQWILTACYKIDGYHKEDGPLWL